MCEGNSEDIGRNKAWVAITPGTFRPLLLTFLHRPSGAHVLASFASSLNPLSIISVTSLPLFIVFCCCKTISPCNLIRRLDFAF